MEDFIGMFSAFNDNVSTVVGLPDISISVVDIVEILIIAVLIYHVLLWIKSTRAWTLFKGILVILVFVLIAAIFQMSTIL